MKSYFAKLADRATLANVPAASAVFATRMSDPFEDTSRQQIGQPPAEASARIRSAPEPRGLVLSPPVEDSTIETKRPLVETHKRTPAKPATEAPTLQPKQSQENFPSERIVEHDLPREPQSLTDLPREPFADNEKSRVAALTPRQAAELRVLHSKEDPRQESEARTKSSDERIPELEREHAVMLRKADAFMNHLLNVQPQRAAGSENELTDESSPTPISRVEREPPNRLEPVARLAPVAAQESDGPSLVIGKLTVEVTPSNSVPPAPQPQRIVVRGLRNRGSGVPTGRRFGLGQF
jgi:hypothetical protein